MGEPIVRGKNRWTRVIPLAVLLAGAALWAISLHGVRGVTASPARAAGTCGDGVVDPDEACDDGNQIDTDACPNDCRRCQNATQQKCIGGVNKRGAKVASTQGKENVACLKDATRGDLRVSLDECLVADAKGKVASAKEKTVAEAAKSCPAGGEPDFGYSGADDANQAAVDEEVAWIHDLFGENAGAAVIPGGVAGQCQTKLVQRAEKVFSTRMKEFLGCKSDRLGAGSVCLPTDLAACLDVVAEDEKGKVGKQVEKLRQDVTKYCAGVDVGGAFPGLCAATEDLAGCTDQLVACRTCRMVNGMDGLDADCDRFDDGLQNGTCGGVPLTPTPPPAPTGTATGSPTPTIVCNGTPLSVSLSPDPILVQYGVNTSVTASAVPATGQYRNWSVKNQDFDVELEFLQQPNCPSETSCTALINAPEVELPAPNKALKVCGYAEAEVGFACAFNGLEARDTDRVELGCAGKSAAECVDFCSQEPPQGQCGTPCEFIGFPPPPYQATLGTCWKTTVNGTDYCYWDHRDPNAPGLGNLCCPNRCYGGAFVVWGQGVGVYACTVIERCDDNPEFAGSECIDVTGTES